MTKAEVRLKMKEIRATFSEEELIKKNKLIHQHLLDLEVFQSSSDIFSYLSFGKEVDTWEILTKYMEEDREGHRVYLPRVEEGQINFYQVKDFNNLSKSRFGVSEPDESHKIPWIQGDGSQSLIMLMPGLAFDRRGNRIGYGAGYYDRYLTTHRATGFIKVALAYDFQLLDQIEGDSYDIPVDYIITQDGIHQC